MSHSLLIEPLKAEDLLNPYLPMLRAGRPKQLVPTKYPTLSGRNTRPGINIKM